MFVEMAEITLLSMILWHSKHVTVLVGVGWGWGGGLKQQ